jgi:predicted DCC family thiol-disulfide oxidoreductase YuxK
MSLKDPILFYDGTCHLCNGAVQFVLKNERKPILMFSSLQSNFAKRHLPNNYTNDLNTLVYFCPITNAFLTKTQAVASVLKQMGGVWTFNGFLIGLFPLFISNVIYDLVAANRYKWFGQESFCIRLNIKNRVLEE